MQLGALKVHIYHGNGRKVTCDSLSQFDIVLTTYETAAADVSMSGVLSRISWFRIVLDEGTKSQHSAYQILIIFCSSSNQKPIHKKLPRACKAVCRTAMVLNRNASTKQIE